jgi:hypothetical protein
MRHPLDPPAAHVAAEFLGHLAAAGLTDAAEVQAVLAGAVARATGVDRCGLATGLAHTFADSRTHWERRRHFAGARIRARLAPLIAAGAPRAAILGAAEAAADESLLPGEARGMATALVAERLRRA